MCRYKIYIKWENSSTRVASITNINFANMIQIYNIYTYILSFEYPKKISQQMFFLNLVSTYSSLVFLRTQYCFEVAYDALNDKMSVAKTLLTADQSIDKPLMIWKLTVCSLGLIFTTGNYCWLCRVYSQRILTIYLLYILKNIYIFNSYLKTLTFFSFSIRGFPEVNI